MTSMAGRAPGAVGRDCPSLSPAAPATIKRVPARQRRPRSVTAYIRARRDPGRCRRRWRGVRTGHRGARLPSVWVAQLLDEDVLTTDDLNCVSFASLASALAGTQKVIEAEALLRRCCPNLTVTGFPETFDAYKQRTPRRADRLYDVVITGLDDDQIRWDVQRDLPRIMIDDATGKDMVARVERVEFGRYGCLGCSRRPAPSPPMHMSTATRRPIPTLPPCPSCPHSRASSPRVS